MNNYMNVMHTTTCNCASCAPAPALGIEMPYEVVKENCLAVACPEAAAMLSDKDKHLAFEVTTGSTKKLTFVCSACKQKFEAIIYSIVNSVKNGTTGCPVCASRKIIPGINDLASQCPEVATMWSSKNKLSASEVAAKSGKKAIFVCRNCKREFETKIYNAVNSANKGNTGCPVCRGYEAVPGINDLASQCPKAAAMWSSKNKLSASEVVAKSHQKAFFKCRDCGQEFETKIANVVRSVEGGTTGCPVCKGYKVVPGVNDLASKCPKAAAMWSRKNKHPASEVTAKNNSRAIFKCPDCGQEFEARIAGVVYSVNNGTTGCSVCAGLKVVSGVNDLATKCPKAATMLNNEDKHFAFEVTAGSKKKLSFVCPDCGKEFKAQIGSVVNSVNSGFTGCYDCMMRRINAISKPEWFYTRIMLAFAGENGIPNPFFDVRNILGENSHLGLDFVDHIQRLCAEYNGSAWHKDYEHVARDCFKFEAAHKAGYTMIRILEPGLEVLDPKYDIVMPDGFYQNDKYDAKIMEEVGRKIINLLEEIYGRKASLEIWALNNFKEFEVWYDANKKELEANARKKGPKGKAAAKKAA